MLNVSSLIEVQRDLFCSFQVFTCNKFYIYRDEFMINSGFGYSRLRYLNKYARVDYV